ncbi:MAG: tRNA preQ1(34) S-adenosylmethionine ribosyltransferase-isomerase QueA [Alphaproteobacteria bacterium]|nr:tRNA preQ1(34) S-adenosylmethionine ribosyltransferase-isomerase QueA [Alphaproteobacteria bacterium]
MRTDLFDFDLPDSLIASSPAHPRDSARMLTLLPSHLRGEGQGGGELSDEIISDFPNHLRPNDIVVFNNTRVIPARLLGKRGEANVEVLLHKRQAPPNGGVWSAFAKPAKKPRIGDEIIFAEDFAAIVLEKLESGEILIDLDPRLRGDVNKKILAHGRMPLPPYIEKKRRSDASDNASYQTVYAAHDGSVAAPTAGLHFTPSLIAALPCPHSYVTLHVGGGTFLPVKSEDTSEHKMHSEWAHISRETAAAINAAKARGGRVVAVGTTSLRTLESATDAAGIVQPFEGETDIFITPGYRFKYVDMLLTNFHLPRSTLFMLVSAFSGLEKMQAAYAHAIANNYRFYSYGDACLLYKTP